VPELPEIEVLRRSLEPLLVGDEIRALVSLSPKLREPLDRAAFEGLVGQRVVALRRRSKYLLIDLSGVQTLVVHLGMSGRLTLVPGSTEREPHEHLRLALASGRALRLVDPRRFGVAFVADSVRLPDDPHFVGLGPEPLEPGFDGAALAAAARGRRGPVKPFLMDAGVVVGVGNIYACESLFRAGIHPNRSVARISRARWDALAQQVVTVLGDAIRQGGTTLNDFVDGRGEGGYFQVSLAAYGREGEPCPRCGAAIRRRVHANRSTFYCAKCQR
jgi:formamidopyrimidine-DNA glycosylase